MADILQCDNVSKDYSNIIALDSVSFSLNQGEILSVFGPSGCGKTTLLRLIAGLETVDKGQIFLNERCLSSKKIHILPEKRNIGMVFQDYSLFPHLNVAANIIPINTGNKGIMLHLGSRIGLRKGGLFKLK